MGWSSDGSWDIGGIDWVTIGSKIGKSVNWQIG